MKSTFVNQVRTMLLNTSSGYLNTAPGNEYVSDKFVPVTLPTGLQNIWNVLFGHNPDALMLNYRAGQYMALLHTECDKLIRATDSRIAYNPQEANLFSIPFGIIITDQNGINGTSYKLNIIGDLEDGTEQLERNWTVITTGNILSITSLTTKASFDYDLTGWSGSTGLLAIPDTTLLLRFNGIDNSLPLPSLTWQLTVRQHPAKTIVDIFNTLKQSGIQNNLNLFPNVEPYLTYQKMYINGDMMTTKLAGILLAFSSAVADLIG